MIAHHVLRQLRWIVAWGALLAGVAGLSAAPQTQPQTPPAPLQKRTSDDQSALQAQREREFKELLTGAQLKGIWSMTVFEEGKAPNLGESREDAYEIHSIEKSGGDYWMVNARIAFGDKDVTVPIMVRVAWADDTPVVTLDNLSIPMIGAYSARVMFHHGFYAGTWYCPSYGGVLSGRIITKKERDAAEKAKVDGREQGEPEPPATEPPHIPANDRP